MLGGVAGASGLALSRDGSTLFVADLGNRCVWSAAADARDLTAGGKNCQSFVSGLPGYPGALAMDADGTLYIGYRWARSSWLEKNADSTLPVSYTHLDVYKRQGRHRPAEAVLPPPCSLWR